MDYYDHPRSYYDDDEHHNAYKRATAAGHPSVSDSNTAKSNHYANVKHQHVNKQFDQYHVVNDDVVNDLLDDIYQFLNDVHDDTDYDQSAGRHDACRYFRPSANDPAVCANCGRDDLDHNDDD